MRTLPTELSSGASELPAAILHLEMQAGERQVLTRFASSFVKWIKNEGSGSFARDGGAPASISVDERADDAETATLQVTVTWARSSAEAVASASAVGITAAAPRAVPASFLFAYDSETPVFEASTGCADVAMIMGAVLNQSARYERATPVRRIADWIPAPLVTEAARAGHALARMPAHAHSVVLSLRSSPRIKPISWVAAGLVAASILYVAWPFTGAVRKPLVRGIAAANPSTSKPATVVASIPDKQPAVLVAGARPAVADAGATAAVVTAAAPIPAPSATPARAAVTVPATRSPAQPRSYVGSLLVTSEPQGADVSVDGVPQGRTPLAIGNLNIGSRVVRLDLPGHQRWSWAVSIVANRRTPIAVHLLPVAADNAAPAVGSGAVSPTRTRTF